MTAFGRSQSSKGIAAASDQLTAEIAYSIRAHDAVLVGELV